MGLCINGKKVDTINMNADQVNSGEFRLRVGAHKKI